MRCSPSSTCSGSQPVTAVRPPPPEPGGGLLGSTARLLVLPGRARRRVGVLRGPRGQRGVREPGRGVAWGGGESGEPPLPREHGEHDSPARCRLPHGGDVVAMSPWCPRRLDGPSSDIAGGTSARFRAMVEVLPAHGSFTQMSRTCSVPSLPVRGWQALSNIERRSAPAVLGRFSWRPRLDSNQRHTL